jgi:hypothetical protein
VDKVSLLLTLYSIVAGLGISRLVQGVTAMIQARSNLRFYWMHTAWIAIVFMAHIVSWFALMRFATGAHWTVFNAMLALFMPILLYVVSDLVVPPLGDGRHTDLREYFFHNCRWFAGLMIAFTVCGGAVQVAVERQADLSGGALLRALAFVTLVAGVSSRRPAIQATVALAMLAIGTAGAALISVKLM